MKGYNCKDCNQEIHKHTILYGQGRCKSCAIKNWLKDSKNHPCYIDNRTNIQHYCIENYCKNKVFRINTRCNICAAIRRCQNPEYIKKQIKSHKGKKFSEEYCEKLSKMAKKRIGSKNPFYGKKHRKETIELMKRKISGKNAFNYGKIMKANWVKYKNTWMRSNWEMWFAQFLTLSSIKWVYESKTFDLGNTTYTPDFYLPKWDLYIEIKGFFSDKAKNKIKRFRKKYSKINFKIFKERKLKEIGII